MEETPYFSKNLVLIGIEAPDKWALIERMIDALAASPAIKKQRDFTPTVLRDAVFSREREQSTGLGDGFAFPHARIAGLERISLCLALPKTPVDFGALDGQPAMVVCMMLVPEEQAPQALRIMAQFARMMSDPVDREFLTKIDDAALLSMYIRRRVLGIDAPVTAADIMRPPEMRIGPDTALREATRLMRQNLLDSVAVTEEDGRIVGEITCDDLFKLGMPDFFSQLKSISFIREFDPFEKYFAGEGSTLARDVMSGEFATIPEEATLLEIVFELAVHRHARVYVVRDGKQVGVIDRILVLDRVINL